MDDTQSKRRPSDAPPIAQELVFNVCDELKREGQPVTNDSVRRRLGGGSFLTIAPLVRAWKLKEDERFRISQFEIPDQVEGAGVEASRLIWKIASELASQQLLDLGRRFTESEQAAGAAAREYEEEIRRLELDLKDGAARLAGSETARLAGEARWAEQLRDLEASLATKSRDLEIAQARIADGQLRAGQLTSELERTRATFLELDRQLQKLSARSEIDQVTLEKLEARLPEVEESLGRERLQRVTAESERERLKEFVAKVQGELKELGAALKESEAGRVRLMSERDQYKERASSAEAAAANLDAIRLTMTRQSEEREREVAALSERLTQMERQMAATELSLDGVRGDLKEISGKKDKPDSQLIREPSRPAAASIPYCD